MIEVNKSKIESVRKTMKDLENYETEGHLDWRIAAAIHELRNYMDELRTERITEVTPIGVIQSVVRFPIEDDPKLNQKWEDLAMAEIRSSFSVWTDKILERFEEAYGLEPVTYEEMLSVIRRSHDFFDYMNGKEQVRYRGWKIYKKRGNR